MASDGSFSLTDCRCARSPRQQGTGIAEKRRKERKNEDRENAHEFSRIQARRQRRRAMRERLKVTGVVCRDARPAGKVEIKGCKTGHFDHQQNCS